MSREAEYCIQVRSCGYHRIFREEGVRMVFCLYPGNSSHPVPMRRARTRCPRCGIEVLPGDTFFVEADVTALAKYPEPPPGGSQEAR